MALLKILIDTNVYFRLAQSIHPLLRTSFGTPPHQLAITEDLEKEFKSNSRLHLKFGWFTQTEYVDNRRGVLTLSNKQKKQFKEDWDTINGIANQLGYVDLSKEDINGIVYALILNVRLVTDDLGMRDVALQLGVSVMSTLELLKLMVDHSHIELKTAKAIAGYWSAMADSPSDLKAQFKKIFGED
ncbi:MAG: hypothetical protein V4736_03620, partial [Bdellovibrionota bacterium]